MTKRNQPDYIFLVCLGLVLFMGVIFLISVSSPLAAQRFKDPLYFLKHQLLFGFIPGLILFFILSRVDYHLYKKYAVILLLLTLVFLVLVLVPGIGFGRGVSRRWIKVGNFLFQPTELAKLTFLIYLAAWLEQKRKEIKRWNSGFFVFVILLLLISLPIIFQPHLSTLIIIFLISLAMFFLAGARRLHILVILGVAGILFLSMIIFAPFRVARLSGFLDPAADPRGVGYHLQQSLMAIGSGGLLGRGFGGSAQKFLYLPETFGDSIFAIMAEELGFVGILVFLCLYGFLIYRGLRIAKFAPDRFGQLLGAGIMFWFFFQCLINIGAMLGLLPLTGVPLPLISYGGSAMTVLLMASGILVNISSQIERRDF